jgi:hypothetical protein
MVDRMKIKLRFNAGDNFGGTIKTREFEVPEGAGIEKILPQVYGSGLARFIDDTCGGHVENGYMNLGKLEAGVTYNICSANISETIKALNTLKELKF